MRALLASLVLLAALCGCSAPDKPAAPAKTYTLRGEIVRVDVAQRIASIKHEKIDGWMEAMTMEFVFKDPAELAKLKPGDYIEGTLYVADLEFYVQGVKVIPPPGSPSGQK